MKFNTAIFYDIENLLKGYGFGQSIIQKLSLKEIFKKIQATEAIGKVAIQRAYANWSDVRLSFMKNELLELGIEPIQVFGFSYGYNKNVADIQLAVEATDLIHTHPTIEVFVVVSGDGGYASLAKKLHEYGKTVIGCAYKNTTNKVLAAVCDNFVWIEDPEEIEEEITSIKTTDNRAIRLLDKIFPIDASYPEADIWAKIKELLFMIQNSSEYKSDLEIGINPSALRELISGVIKGFDYTKLGFGKFVEFLQKALEGTDMCIYTMPPSDLKIAFKNRKFNGYTVLDSSNLKQIPSYADIQATDPRLQRMQRKIQCIKATEKQNVILKKVQEIINWIENDEEFKTDLKIAGCSPSVLREAINVTIIGFNPIKFGYTKFIDFLKFVLANTSLGIWQCNQNTDVKVGFRNFPIKNYTLISDVKTRELHSVECYKDILMNGSPIFKLPSYDILKMVAISLQQNPINDLFFGEALEQLLNTQEFQVDQESFKFAFSNFISADCFIKEPENAKLSEQKLTLKEEYYSYEKLIDQLKVEMQKKILFSIGDCKKEVFEELFR